MDVHPQGSNYLELETGEIRKNLCFRLRRTVGSEFTNHAFNAAE
jgi:hypothetical protein